MPSSQNYCEFKFIKLSVNSVDIEQNLVNTIYDFTNVQ